MRANSEFYYSNRNTSGIRRQAWREGNVLKASLEYYDTVKIRLEMVPWPWIYRRCYDVIAAYTYVAMFGSVGDVSWYMFAGVRCLIRRIKVIGYGNLVYGEERGRGRVMGSGFISALLANTKKFYWGSWNFYPIFSFFLVSVEELTGFFFWMEGNFVWHLIGGGGI